MELFNFVGPNKCYLMIQWGSGNFEYSFNNEIIFTGRIKFITEKTLIISSDAYQNMKYMLFLKRMDSISGIILKI